MSVTTEHVEKEATRLMVGRRVVNVGIHENEMFVEVEGGHWIHASMIPNPPGSLELMFDTTIWELIPERSMAKQ